MTDHGRLRPQILYIAGVPRIGSTVLGRLLGEAPDAVFAGELNFFWRRFAHGELCSCRRPLPECPFWSEVVRRAYGDDIRAAERASLERRVLRRYFLLGLAPPSAPVRRLPDVDEMLAERERFYDAVAERAGTPWIIDGGKEPVYASFLARLPSLDVHTVHLVRDPRGVAYSWQKKVVSDSEPRDMPRRSPAATAADWDVQNLFIQLRLQALSSSYVRIRYEDFVVSPRESLKEIATVTGCPLPDAEAAVSEREEHLVAGNPGVRQRGDGRPTLRRDEEWHAALPARQQRVVSVLSSGLMAWYRYPLRRQGATRRESR